MREIACIRLKPFIRPEGLEPSTPCLEGNENLKTQKAGIPPVLTVEESNEPCWIRTGDPLLKRQMLYHLS